MWGFAYPSKQSDIVSLSLLDSHCWAKAGNRNALCLVKKITDMQVRIRTCRNIFFQKVSNDFFLIFLCFFSFYYKPIGAAPGRDYYLLKVVPPLSFVSGAL